MANIGLDQDLHKFAIGHDELGDDVHIVVPVSTEGLQVLLGGLSTLELLEKVLRHDNIVTE